MDNNEIITLYKIGKSIDFITAEFYKRENKNIKNNYYNKYGNYIVTKKEISKIEARHHVETVIFNYIKSL